MAQTSQVTNTPLVPEDDDWNDNDSAIGATSITSSTTSIGESILQYRKENGRTYHAYKDGQYLMPNDEAENDRADLQHHLTILTLENKLFLCPAGKENTLHRVLDVGTGTGIWAIDYADEHPESEVLGIDLSPIQPYFVPANVVFQVDDLDQPWTFSHKFDFIYSRMMTGSFSNWPRFFSQVFANLNPGGFLELLDPLYPVVTDDDTFPPDSAIVKWCQYIMKAAASNGHPLQTATDYKTQMEDAGFVDVKQHVFKWPLNRWPKDKKAKELGMWVHAAVADGLESISLASLTRIIGMSLSEAEVFLSEVRKEMKDTKIHAYFPIYVFYGQKPK